MSNYDSTTPYARNLNDIFQVIAKNPLLEQIHISDSYGYCSSPQDQDAEVDFTTTGRITLHKLTSFSLYAPISQLVRVLRRLVTPNLHSLTVDTNQSCDSQSVIEDLMGAIYKYYAHPLSIKRIDLVGNSYVERL